MTNWLQQWTVWNRKNSRDGCVYQKHARTQVQALHFSRPKHKWNLCPNLQVAAEHTGCSECVYSSRRHLPVESRLLALVLLPNTESKSMLRPWGLCGCWGVGEPANPGGTKTQTVSAIWVNNLRSIIWGQNFFFFFLNNFYKFNNVVPFICAFFQVKANLAFCWFRTQMWSFNTNIDAF